MQSQEQVKAERRGGLRRFLPGDSSPPAEGLDALIRRIKSESPRADLKEIQRAFAFADASHAGQKRISGEDFIGHPLGVATILADLGMDTTTLVAALVEWLTAPPSRNGDACRAYYAHLAAAGPADAHVLKLADRTDNLRSIQALVMRTGDRHRRWAGRYLDLTREQVVPLTGDAPSIARVTLFTAMADLAPLLTDGLTES